MLRSWSLIQVRRRAGESFGQGREAVVELSCMHVGGRQQQVWLSGQAFEPSCPLLSQSSHAQPCPCLLPCPSFSNPRT